MLTKDRQIEQLKRYIQQLESRIQQLEGENKDLKENLDETTKELDNTKEKLDNALGKLAYYEGPNVPSSQQKMKKKTKSKSPTGKKRGAPNGHKGVTRERKEPNRVVPVSEDKCPKCGSENIEEEVTKEGEIATEESIIDEIPPVTEVETIKFVRIKYKCNDCGAEFTGEHEECPKSGIFGINLMVLIVLLRFLPRAVLRRIVEMMEHTHSLKITPASVNAVILRVAKAANKEYGRLMHRIRLSDIVYVDETGISVLGKKWWVWTFRTYQDILIVIRSSRGGNVLEEMLGKEFRGIIVCDGWSAYNILKHARIQRCWAHLLRWAEKYDDSIPGRNLHKKLKLMFKEMKSFINSEPSRDMREKEYAEFNVRMSALIKYYSKYEQLDRVITYMTNGGSNWFTCVLYEGVEPTNNFAEHALREMVVIRKIIGALRSTKKGPMIYERFASLIATWKLNNLNIQKELKRVIVENMCVSS